MFIRFARFVFQAVVVFVFTFSSPSFFSESLMSLAYGEQVEHKKFSQKDAFRQLEEILPTPNSYRTASGAPGHKYWQQRADYDIHLTLDDKKQHITGTETVTYKNNSPDTLRYLWFQMDANRFTSEADSLAVQTTSGIGQMSFRRFQGMLLRKTFDGSFHISKLTTSAGKDLSYTIVKTMMRVDLKSPLKPGQTAIVKIEWDYTINDAKAIRARTGYEYFKDEDNYIYEIAQFHPRLVSYNDTTGWQHKQFLGSGEFTVDFGKFDFRLTLPNDHIVAATGTLQNPNEVLTTTQRERLQKSKTSKTPVFIVTPKEAKINQAGKPTGTKTWFFKAENVRDFAFACSRKFIWDAQLHNVEGNNVMAMSFYPIEGEPLWSKYSTHAIIHTLDVYSRYTFAYPYPTAISVNGPIGGMEYPMICFNGPRPEKDGTYSSGTKYGLISVIIHEVGHNYFPMIVNSDERQWTWMDEGLNTFLQYLAEQEWEDNYPSRRGEPQAIARFMRSKHQVPIMTNAESVLHGGSNAYAKPATALNILRETILGRELFDFAFKEYATRWKFKRPMPADFFRTMEDASGVDLDWFWRGWFYTTAHVDISLTNVQLFEINTNDPDIETQIKKKSHEGKPTTLSEKLNEKLTKRANLFPELKDFYNHYDPFEILSEDREKFKKYIASLETNQLGLLKKNVYFYVASFENIGGLVMPIILELHYEDGSSKIVKYPAEIWRRDNLKVSKLIIADKKINSITLDPRHETADTDLENNRFPREIVSSRFKLYKSSQRRSSKNLLKVNKKRKEKQDKKKEDARKAALKKALAEPQKVLDPLAADLEKEVSKATKGSSDKKQKK